METSTTVVREIQPQDNETVAQVIFEYIDAPIGDTGHFSCPVRMIKSIQ